MITPIIKDTKNADIQIIQTLRLLGITPNLKGYEAIRSALKLILGNPELVHMTTRVLYPLVAKELDSIPSRVERNIRQAIEGMFNRMDLNLLQEHLGLTLRVDKLKLTNSEFLGTVAEVIRVKLGAYGEE